MSELNAICEDPDLWNDQERAQSLMKERTKLDQQINAIKELEQQLEDSAALIELGEEEGEEEIVAEAEQVLAALKVTCEARQLESMLSGEVDENDAYLEVHAGSGGTEAQDWAEMLLRMYTRWAGKNGYNVSMLEYSDGDEAGMKSATIKIMGDKAYGWLKTENGVHRLVRISPFDSNARRHTSFASIAVAPVIDDSIEIDVAESDLRVDTYRSSGAGGQHVNTTDSAVRITHVPTGVVAACQSERSQHQNRANALEMLKAKLYELEMQKRQEEKMAAHGEKTEIGWGHQIRSYVLHPYQMIKDLRTGFETTNSSAVLDGDLNGFLEASLAHGIGTDSEEQMKKEA